MEAFESVHRLLQQGLEQGAYPSAAAAAGIGPELYFKQTYGACDTHTLFDPASVTKILSPTMIALHFLETGTLRLTDTVEDFFPDAPADKRKITVEQLMTHTSIWISYRYAPVCQGQLRSPWLQQGWRAPLQCC